MSVDKTWEVLLLKQRSKCPNSELYNALDNFLNACLASDVIREDSSRIIVRIFMREFHDLVMDSPDPEEDGGTVSDFILNGRGAKVLLYLENMVNNQNDVKGWWNKAFIDCLLQMYQICEKLPSRSSSLSQDDKNHRIGEFSAIFNLLEIWKNQYQSKGKKRKRRKNESRFPSAPRDTRFNGCENLLQFELNLEAEDKDSAASTLSSTSIENCNPYSDTSVESDLRIYPPNPLDFDFFDMKMYSEDEAKYLIDWRKNRDKSLDDESLDSRSTQTIPEVGTSINGSQCQLLILILIESMLLQVIKKRKLNISTDLSVKVLHFCSKRYNYTNSLMCKSMLLKMIFLSLVEAMFNEDFAEQILKLDIIPKVIALAEESLEKKINEDLIFKSIATLMKILNTCHIINDAMYGRNNLESDITAIVTEFERCNGFVLLKRLIHVSTNEQDASGMDFLETLVKFLGLSRFLRESASAGLARSFKLTHLTLFRCLSDIVRSERNPKELSKTCTILEKAALASSIELKSVWEMFFLTSTDLEAKTRPQDKIFHILEKLVRIHEPHSKLSRVHAKVPRGPDFDYDSAFSSSDVSNEKGHQNEYDSVLKLYREALQSPNSSVICRHLARLTVGASWSLREEIFSQVLEPILGTFSILKLDSCNVDMVRQILQIIVFLLPNGKILHFFHKRQVYKLVMKLSKYPDLCLVSLKVLRIYMILEIEFFLRNSSSANEIDEKDVQVTSEEPSTNDSQVTEEEAFRPNFLNALNLATIVKGFYDFLQRTTSDVIQKLKSIGEPVARTDLESLHQVWKTQSTLFELFQEFSAYCVSKNISMTVKDLFDGISGHILKENLDLESFKILADTFRCLLNISVVFVSRISSPTLQSLDLNGLLSRQLVTFLLKATSSLPWFRMHLLIKACFDSNLRHKSDKVIFRKVYQDINENGDNGHSDLEDKAGDASNTINDDDGFEAAGESTEDDEVAKSRPITLLNSQDYDIHSVSILKTLFKIMAAKTSQGHPRSGDMLEYLSYRTRILFQKCSSSARKIHSEDLLSSILSLMHELLQGKGSRSELISLLAALGESNMPRNQLKQIVDLLKGNDIIKIQCAVQILQSISIRNLESKVNYSIVTPMLVGEEHIDRNPASFLIPRLENVFKSSSSLFLDFWVKSSAPYQGGLEWESTVISLNSDEIKVELSIVMDSSQLSLHCGRNKVPLATTTGAEWNNVVLVISKMVSEKRFMFVTFCDGNLKKKWYEDVTEQCSTEYEGAFELTIGDIAAASRHVDKTFLLGPVAILSTSLDIFHRNFSDLLDNLDPNSLDFTFLNSSNLGKDITPIALFHPESATDHITYYNVSTVPTSFIGGMSDREDEAKITRSSRSIKAKGEVKFTLNQHLRLGDVIMDNGGVAVCILLVARAVEANLDDHCLCQCLETLFNVIHANPGALEDYEKLCGSKCLALILSADGCQFGLESLMILLKCAFQVGINTLNGQLKVTEPCQPVIPSRQALELLLELWKPLSKSLTISAQQALGCRTGLSLFFKVLDHFLIHSICDKDNLCYLKRVVSIKKLAFDLLGDVSFSESNNRADLLEAAQHILGICRSLLGSPVDLEVLQDIMKTILLFHDPKLTFVSHDRSSFFFTLGDCTGIKNEKLPGNTPDEIIVIPRKRHSMNDGQLFRNSTPELSPNPMHSSQVVSIDPEKLLEQLESRHPSSSKDKVMTSNLDPWSIPGQSKRNPHPEEDGQDLEAFPATVPELWIEGLLKVVSGCLLNISDRDVSKVLNDIVSVDYIIVLCKSHSLLIREAVTELFCLFVMRSSCLDDYSYHLQKLNGYFLVANQLHTEFATEKLVSSCLSIVHNRQLRLWENVELPSYSEIELRSSGMILLLAILPNVVHDIALAHGLIVHIHEIVSKCPGMLRNLHPLGLFEVLGKILINLADSTTQSTDVVGQDSRDIVFQDIFDFLRLIALKLVSSKGQENSSHLFELVHTMVGIASIRDKQNLDIGCFVKAISAILEESMSESQSRIFQTDYPLITHHNPRNIYSGLYPVEEITDMIMRNEAEGASMLSDSSSDGASSRRMVAGRETKLASRSELVDRLASLVDLASEFIALWNIQASLEDEVSVSKLSTLLSTLIMTEIVNRFQNSKAKPIFSNLLKLKRRFITLLNDILMPSSQFSFRIDTLHLLKNQFKNLELVRFVYDNNVQLLLRTKLLLENMIIVEGGQSNDAVLSFYNSVTILANNARNCIEETDEEKENRIRFEVDKIMFEGRRSARKFLDLCETTIAKSRKYTDLSQKIAEYAIAVTKNAMGDQDRERKEFMLHLRTQIAQRVKAQGQMSAIVERLTHERGMWHFPEKSPKSWVLSEFEGPDRVRIRMEKRNSNMAAKYYKPNFKHKEKSAEPAFSFLFNINSKMAVVVVEQLNAKESIKLMEKVTLVLPDTEIPGEILLSDTSLYFVAEQEGAEIISYRWQLDCLRDVWKRWYQLEDRALELFFSWDASRLFVFSERKRRNFLIKSILDTSPPLEQASESSAVMEKWREGEVSNFDYIMYLNKFAGRSFNDLMQYPIFPFILSDYESSTIDLLDPAIFRNLKKPIGIQYSGNEAKFVETYTMLADEASSNHSNSTNTRPFHYGSHYSNTGIVLHFMIRVLPFTRLFVKYQDGSFDVPDRTFRNIRSTWELSSRDSMSDVKELIPEMFCMPEMFRNQEGFDFGVKQDGQAVNDVILPPWAKNDARLFVKIHRQALESRNVCEHLSHWVDLVFGYKQTGQEAINSINVFHPSTYYGFDVTSIHDPVQRNAHVTMIKTYGQTPKQLFKHPHPRPTRNWTLSATNEMQVIPRVLDSVRGLKWGKYLGSPSEANPTIVWKSGPKKLAVDNFISLPSGDVYGLPRMSTLLVKVDINHDKKFRLLKKSGLLGASLLRVEDFVITSKIRKSLSESVFVAAKEIRDVCIINTHSEQNRVWLGFHSGKIQVHDCDFDLQTSSLRSKNSVTLYGHEKVVTSLEICHEFGIVVSGSRDHTAIIWDANSFKYVQTLFLENPVTKVTISKTCGDIVIIEDLRVNSSKMSLFSVNGELVKSLEWPNKITSLEFSSQPEGLSCNVIVTGHSNGTIKMWNSWDMTPVRDLSTEQNSSITALRFNHNNQNLFVSTELNGVIIYEKKDVRGIGNTPKYIDLNQL